MFDKGMEVLWISGERKCQRNPYRLFDIYDDRDENPNLKLLTEEDRGVIAKMNIVLLDYFDSETIRKVVAKNSPYADRENLHLLPELPNNIEVIEEFVQRLRENLEIANEYSGTIFALNNYKTLDKTFSKICKELNLPLEVNESYDQYSKVSTNYFLNSVYFANYHDTPYLDNKGSWYMQLGSKKLRELARAINDYEPLEYKEML